LSNVFVICQIEGCKLFNKVEYIELDRFRRHLARDHDRYDLYQLAYDKGIIQDPIRYHNPSYVIQQIAELSRVERNQNAN